MAVLSRTAAAACLLLLLPAAGRAHMGPSFPLAHGGGEEAALMAQVVASYISEQMGREVKLLQAGAGGDDGEALAAVERRVAPLAVVSEAAWGERRAAFPSLTGSGPALPGPGGLFRLVAGREAAAQLSFSLLPDYAARLARATAGWDWAKALGRVRAGEGRRKVALDLLRAADLI